MNTRYWGSVLFHLSFLILLPFFLFSGCDQSSTIANYPNRTIVLICPWAAGGGTDRVARMVGQVLEKELGRAVVVQNQTGGSGTTGHTAGASAGADGYTLTFATSELITFKPLGISELAHARFKPIFQVNADAAAIIVGKNSPWKTLGEFLEAAKAQPGKLKMSGTASGGVWDLARTGLLQKAGMKAELLLWVPSQGAAPALVELLGGHIEAVTCSLPEARAQLVTGEARALCIMSEQRHPMFPDIPTAKEQGIDFTAGTWRGVMGPAEMPDEIVARLAAALSKVAQSPEFTEFMKLNGYGVELRGPKEFTDFLNEQQPLWEGIIKSAGLGAQG